MSSTLAGLSAALFTLLLTSTALADGWVATKLRGKVVTLVDGQWQPLGRGDIVFDERLVRTLRSGRVTLQRGEETIDVASDTQIRIHDRSGRKYTTVLQDFGTVSVEADVRAVRHFSVKTPHLAAVVKGTRFTVTSGERTAEVTVQRGSVAVEDSDTHQSTVVVAGQSAGTSAGAPLIVAGRGDLPVVRNADGTPANPRKAAEQAAASSARNAALAGGLSAKEAEKAARDAAKDAREEAREAAKESRSEHKEARAEAKESAKEAREEAKEARSESRGSDNSGTGDGTSGHGGGGGNSGGSSDGGSGNGNSGGGGGNSGGGDSGNSGGGNGHSKKD